MTAIQLTGALSSRQMALYWLEIDWDKIKRSVYRLQVRIAKAAKEGRYGKVKSLQWLLARSHHAKLLAIKRVTESKGSRTAGVDQEVWVTSTKKYQAIQCLNAKGYKAMPLRRIYIPKRRGKLRPLSIPTMRDRAMQALYLLALTPVAEVTGDVNSYGFRPKRSAQDACHQSYIVLSGKHKAQWVLEADIESCFDHISHEWLLTNICMDKRVLKQWLTAGYIENNTQYETRQGTPQGGVSSPVLANMVLDGLEKAIHTSVGKGNKVNFIRYADDFIVTGKSPELLKNQVIPAIEDFLKPRGLRLSKEKTAITHISNGFDFLGFNIRKYQGKYLSKPTKESQKRLLAEIKSWIVRSYGWSACDLINVINPIITGWANYYRGSAAKATYAKMDNEIFKMCLYWARRKYKKRQNRKAVARYFRSRSPTRGWVFSDIKTKEGGKKEVVFIKMMMDVKIQRHVKIRGEAHPFDAAYWDYFDNRKKWKQRVSIVQRSSSARIYAQMQSILKLG